MTISPAPYFKSHSSVFRIGVPLVSSLQDSFATLLVAVDDNDAYFKGPYGWSNMHRRNLLGQVRDFQGSVHATVGLVGKVNGSNDQSVDKPVHG
jgi:hypothetical protein